MKLMRYMVMVGMLLAICVMLPAAPGGDLNGDFKETINIGFLKSLFSDVNINDAVVSIEVWADIIARSKDIPVDMKVAIFESCSSLEAALAEGTVDLVGLLTPEVLEIGRRVPLDHFYGTTVRGNLTEEYVLLVRKDSGLENLSQLSGMTLKSLNNGRCSLAPAWLKHHLEQLGLAEPSRFFASIQYEVKANMVILPVFFGKVEACLVTRNALATMAELNPQVGRDLEAIAQSPSYLPAVFCFRKDFQSEYLDRILEGLDELHTQPSGEQVLIVFRGDRLVRITEEGLHSARVLMDQLKQVGPLGSPKSPAR